VGFLHLVPLSKIAVKISDICSNKNNKMINVGENLKTINDLLSKNNGVYISPQEYMRYGNMSQNEMFDDFCGIKTTPRVTYGRNRLVDERLNPFRKRVALAFVSELLTKPTNLKAITAVYTQGANPVPVKPVDEDRYAMIFQDPLASPNDEDIYYIEEETKLRLLGDDALSVWVEYLERPTPIVYAFTEVNNRYVYNDAGSTHYQWDKSEEAELTNRILLKAGLSMKDVMAIQTASNQIAQE